MSLFKPLKIVHVITRFIRGGADENTLLTCNGQAAQGHDVTLVIGAEFHPTMLGQLDPRVRLIGIPHLVRHLSPQRDLLCFLALYRQFRTLAPDVVHTHESKAGVLGRTAAAVAGVRLRIHGVHILAFQAEPGWRGGFFQAVEQLVSHVTHGFVHVSPELQSACLAAGIGPRALHVVARSGMDIARYRNAKPASWREDTRFAAVQVASPRFILVGGTLEPRKRVREFLDVFARVAREEPRAILVVAGDGSEREAIAAAVAALGLDDRVVLLGYVDDLAPWIAMAHVCAHAAQHEGLPRVIIQYAIAGRQVVTTDLPGVSEVIGAAGGAVVPIDRLDEMAPHLLEVLSRPAPAEAPAPERFASWDIRQMNSTILSTYDQLLKSG